MTLEKMLLEIASRYPTQVPMLPHVFVTCSRCRYSTDIGDDGLCSDCRETLKRGYEISQLAGRCANGAERDHGVLYHARLLYDDGLASLAAVCGCKPGRRSVGWSDYNPQGRKVTCSKCVQRLANYLPPKNQHAENHLVR